jgi:hypothetical protein
MGKMQKEKAAKAEIRVSVTMEQKVGISLF